MELIHIQNHLAYLFSLWHVNVASLFLHAAIHYIDAVYVWPKKRVQSLVGTATITNSFLCHTPNDLCFIFHKMMHTLEHSVIVARRIRVLFTLFYVFTFHQWLLMRHETLYLFWLCLYDFVTRQYMTWSSLSFLIGKSV